MAATTLQPTARNRLVLGFAKRLGLQAVMSVMVMAGLQFASLNGYDVRDLLPEPARGVADPLAEPVRVVGVPTRFDRPVQAGGPLDRLRPEPQVEPTAARETGPSTPAATRTATSASPAAASVARAGPPAGPVATPTPRPAPAAARPAAVPPPPSDVRFDVTPRGLEVDGVAELANEERPPVPIEVGEAGFRVVDLAPSGVAVLARTAEVTSSAAHVVVGTASRLLDLVR